MIPFNKPHLTGNELKHISKAAELGQLAGDGYFTQLCSSWLEENIGCIKSLLTPSCTAALEMAAILINIQPGDEVIMPSYTFVSSANAFVLRGGVPVFVDIREDSLNIDENLIEQAITEKTKAIVAVHYAGFGCEMNEIMRIAKKHNLYVIEDAAQGIKADYEGHPLGSIGDIGCLSFHETKNIISGEGGALLINNRDLVDRAEIIRDKGTDRSKFFRGQVDKYSWKDIGSSFLPGELIAAFLWAQLNNADIITKQRLDIWNSYHNKFSELLDLTLVKIPSIPDGTNPNGHLFYLILKDVKERKDFITSMKKEGVHCVFHYIPLHSSDGGKKYGKVASSMKVTDSISERIVRLPIWIGLNNSKVIEAVLSSLR